ncbi:kinase-like protein [Jaminaea rosea]|uniref:Kinase-like protein n=1 Tax=Jaminaea rosea TaxID=1569628 RepID=A0A316UPS3_9BASI|nr:kinase-like protein [Jaminaea rosea]PWN27302.1 kinase-like protein [Jaminaea rosea]
MDRFDVVRFEDLTGPNGGEWIRIGGGSFGVVYKGEYLGTPVAIKEVLPNNTYDVEKYFERECVLMKEARHPNITQYIGLTKSPGQDGRIYIISEFVGGNVRSYIADKRKPFGWRLRMSFAMDIARALAYLHARNCMHRDLKGENLLITTNDRIKICDFGFARIAARNEEEMRRISYCGTDGYMSPEILLGLDFGLPSDIFSLGVIFCEIASRHLVDSTTFKREMPSFGLDEGEVRDMADEGCPEGFVQLCIDCVEVEQQDRPDMREVVRRLREIEMDVVEREMRETQGRTLRSVGSVRGTAGGSRRPGVGPRMPSFDGQVKPLSQAQEHESIEGDDDDDDDDDVELESALAQLEAVSFENAELIKNMAAISDEDTMKVSGHGNPWWHADTRSTLPSIRNSWIAQATNDAEVGPPKKASSIRPSASRVVSGDSDYSTSVVRKKKGSELSVRANGEDGEDAGGSTLTVRASDDSQEQTAESHGEAVAGSFLTASSRFSTNGHNQEPSLAVATVASSIYSPAPLYHRFTLVKNGIKRVPSLSKLRGGDASTSSNGTAAAVPAGSYGSAALLPPAIMLANALAKCHVCSRRIGWKPFLDCDDCTYKCHVGCGEYAEPTCLEMEIPAAGHEHGIISAVHANGQRSASSGSTDSNGSSKPSPRASPANGGQAAHALRQAAAAAHAAYSAEGGEATPPPTAHSTLKGLPAGRGQNQQRRGSQSPSPAANEERDKERKVKGLKRWSVKASPTRA